VIRLGGLLAATGAVLALCAAVAVAGGGVGASHPIYEWRPHGEGTDPTIMLQEKSDLTGKFDVQCGSLWIASGFGGGGTADPFTFSGGMLSGSLLFPTGSAGDGSSGVSAEVNYFDFHNAGPLEMQLSGTGTEEKAVGTLTLHLYKLVKVKRRGSHRTSTERELRDDCAVHFEAPNYYYEPPAAAEPSPPASAAQRSLSSD
jgi:hypothetical protein